jgi:thymidylate synthase (FAD)
VTERQFLLTDTPPKIFVVGLTTPHWGNFQDYLDYRERIYVDGTADREDGLVNAHQPANIIAFGGKVCYDSFHNPGDKTLEAYIQGSIISHLHGSVLEHATLNLMCASVPRSTQLELVRHRQGMGYSWQSTRFTDKRVEYVIPPLIRENEDQRKFFESFARHNFQKYCEIADSLGTEQLGEEESKTLRRKRVKEAARSILPNSLGSDGLVTFNGRSLRHVLEVRSDPSADASIREFAYAVYQAVLPYVPELLADVTVVPQTFGAPQLVFKHRKV